MYRFIKIINKMKYLLTLILLSAVISLSAQQKAEITEGLHLMSKGTYPAFSMKIESASAEFILKQWKSFIKRYKGKTSYNKKMQEVFSDDAKLKDMSANTVDIYARVVGNEEKGHLELLVWFNLGVNYLSTKDYPDRAQDAYELMEAFMQDIEIDLIKIAIKEEKKRLKDEEKALKKLEKTVEKYLKTIAKYEEQINEIQSKIDGVEEDKSKVSEEVEKQKTIIKDKETEIVELEQSLKSLKRR
jgi:tetratricopeptide (TPR) repeat protein